MKAIPDFLFRSVEDLDLFVGGLAEESSSDTLLGPTFSCIFGNQFKNLRNGDRFWYENKRNGGFSEGNIIILDIKSTFTLLLLVIDSHLVMISKFLHSRRNYF